MWSLLNGDYLLYDILSFERHASGNHFVKHHAQTPDVSAIVESLHRQRLLGRHVTYSSHYDACFGVKQFAIGVALLPDGLRETEVEHLHDAVAPAQHDVFRLDVAMDDVRLMRCIQSGGDLDANLQHFVKIQTM